MNHLLTASLAATFTVGAASILVLAIQPIIAHAIPAKTFVMAERMSWADSLR